MSAQLSTYKRLLSKYCAKLETVIARLKSEKLETIELPDQDTSPLIIRESHRRLEEGIGAIETCNTKIQEILQNYAVAIDKYEELNGKETEDFEEYISKGETSLCASLDYIVLLKARVNAFNSCTPARSMTTGNWGNDATAEGTVGIKKVELPTLPTPIFHGDLWEWDNFWTLFDTNVNSQPLPELYKFNYLLKSLRGEPLQAVKKFRVSQDNYAKAINFLKTKYGDNEQLINKLYDRLEKLKSTSQTIRDQRKLLEQVQAIVAQLREKNEHVDNQCIMKQVLSKFPIRLQRKVLERKYTQENNTFGMETLLKLLEEFITTEEKVSFFTREVTPRQQSLSTTFSKGEEPNKWIIKCMYCGDDHKSIACTKYTTPHSRTQYLREHKLCFICASPKHITADCKKRMCFECQGPHHTSCCFRKDMTGGDKRNTYQKAKETKPKESRNLRPAQTKPAPVTSTKVHQTSRKGEEEKEAAICELQASRTGSTYLPTGEIQVMNPITRSLRKIPVLLDTGAELSFIDKNLADELHLPTIETTKLKLRTFGSEKINETSSRKVELEAWDAEGNAYQLQLLTYDILTKPLKTPPLLEKDMQFMQSLNLKTTTTKDHKPLILLGCDQLWQLIKEDTPHVKLPSGLHLLPTKLGHLLTGQVHTNEQVTQVTEDDNEELEIWDKYWSLESQVNGVVEEVKERKNSVQKKGKNTSKLKKRITTKEKPKVSKRTETNSYDFSSTEGRDEFDYLTEVIALNMTMTRAQHQQGLERTKEELKQQVEVITAIKQEWLDFKKQSHPLTQRIITLGRLLRAAGAASDCYLKLGTRYILLAKCLPGDADQEMLNDRFLRKIRLQKKQMSALINQLEKEAEIVENVYEKRIRKSRQAELYDYKIRRLQQRLRGKDKKLFEIKLKRNKSRASPNGEFLIQSGKREVLQKGTGVPGPMVDEEAKEHPETEESPVAKKEQVEEHLQYKLTQRRQLRDKLNELEKAPRILRHRRMADVKRRTHEGITCTFCRQIKNYLDSSPKVSDGDKRFNKQSRKQGPSISSRKTVRLITDPTTRNELKSTTSSRRQCRETRLILHKKYALRASFSASRKMITEITSRDRRTQRKNASSLVLLNISHQNIIHIRI